MSNIDELEEYDAELELRLKKEYADVYGLFRYCVLTQEATYLCNQLDLKIEHQPSYPMIHVAMEDVWVWDKNRPTRIIPRTDIHTTQDVTIEELRPPESTPPLDAADAVALDAARRRRRQHADAPGTLARRRARAHLAHRDAAAAHERRPGGAARRAARPARPRHERGERARRVLDRAGARGRVDRRGRERARGRHAADRPGRAQRHADPHGQPARGRPRPHRQRRGGVRARRRALHRRRLRHLDELRRGLGAAASTSAACSRRASRSRWRRSSTAPRASRAWSSSRRRP